MEEILKVGDSFQSWAPLKQKQPDGSWSYVQDLAAGGLLSVPEKKTVLEIIPRPENQEEAVRLVREILENTTRNQNVVDGKLYHADNEEIGHLFDPGCIYIVES